MTTARKVVRGSWFVACVGVAGCLAAGREAPPMHVPSEPVAAGVNNRQPGFVGFPEYPSLSPDGATVVFAWAGDLWGAPTAGGICTRITAHPGNESRSVFSPDGSRLAFESDRDGAKNLYIAPISRTAGGLVAGAVRRVTVSDRPHTLAGFTADGQGLLFHAAQEPAIYRGTRMYRVDIVASDGQDRPLGAVGGPEFLLTRAFGMWPRSTSDGKAIVFQRNQAPWERPTYRGSGTSDVWRMTMTEGSFVRVTDDPANDMEPCPLQDGSILVISSRDGQNNVWRVGPGEGDAARQLTAFAPMPGQLTIGHGVRDLAVSADGSTAVFAVWDRLYRLDLRKPDATPVPIELSATGDYAAADVQRLNVDKDATEALLSPDGKTVAVVARGDVFVRNTTEGYPTRRVTDTTWRERDLAWSPDGRVLYFASDMPAGEGQGLVKYHIYGTTVELSRDDLVPEKEKEKQESSGKNGEKKADGENPPDKTDDAGASEKSDASKKDEKPAESKDKKSKDQSPDFGKRWAAALRFKVEPVVEGDDEYRHPVPSPDGRMLAFIRNLGDAVLRNLETGQDVVLFKGWNEPEFAWAPDSRYLIYAVEDLDFNSDIWVLDTGGAEAPAEFKLAAPVNLTRHPDNDISPRLSADGKLLTFLSERGTSNDQQDVYQVSLDKTLDAMSAYEKDEYFKKAAESAGKRKPSPTPEFVLRTLKGKVGEEKKADAAVPSERADAAGAKENVAGAQEKEKDKTKKQEPIRIDADDAYLRIRRLTTSPGEKGNLAITPGADRVLFTAPAEGDVALFSIDHKGKDLKSLQSGSVSNVTVSLSGDKALYIRQGVVNSVGPKGGGKSESLAIDAPVVVEIARQQRQKFMEAARTFGDRFYHPTMKGLDWAALTRRYLPLAEQTRTPESFNRVTQMLFGETNGSHTGIFGGTPPVAPAASPAVGYLGVRVEPAAGGYKITRVLLESPAAGASPRLEVGDLITAIDGRRLAPDAGALPSMDLDAALAGRAGRETLVEFTRESAPGANGAPAAEKVPSAGAARVALVTPVAWAAWDAMHYAQEVRDRRAVVEKISGSRLGYLHIRGMSEPEVRVFERDLYAAAHGKEGLIIDVRDNGGGFTADILLSSLTAPRHAYTIPRGADPNSVPFDAYPRDRRLIYGWTRPINVLINQNSFSNAEIFAHAIKTTSRGHLVGTATFGGVISTGAFTLIDGTVVRMPFRGWYLPGGQDMENNGAKPDASVPQLPGEEATGRDAQLEAAVRDLLTTLDEKPRK